ncbi:MAG: spore cortex-lytic enzyme [Clostridia bacterium]|nr:spore cortex-lytic enzyme [Clostridia bacterium]
MKTKKYLKISVIILMMCMLLFSVMLVQNKKSVHADVARTREIQTRLANYGYYSGEINGWFDDATVGAIKRFQANNGLNVTGAVDGATAEALGIYMSKQENYDLYLLAKCIHAEARGESYLGKVAVGAVILNRVASADFPNTVYGVIYQPWAFTCTEDGQINLEPDRASYQAAQDALNGWDPTYGCIYYYNPKTATSSWIWSREVVTTIGDHVFCV